MSKYNLSAPSPPPRSPRASPLSAPSSHPGGDRRINPRERGDHKEMSFSSGVFAFFVLFAVNPLWPLQPVPSLTPRAPSHNPPIHQSTNPSIHQSINPPIHQSTNPSIHQSTSARHQRPAPVRSGHPRFPRAGPRLPRNFLSVLQLSCLLASRERFLLCVLGVSAFSLPFQTPTRPPSSPHVPPPRPHALTLHAPRWFPHSCTIPALFLPHFLARAFHNHLCINHLRICPAPNGAIPPHKPACLKSIAIKPEKVQVIWASEAQIRSLETRPFNRAAKRKNRYGPGNHGSGAGAAFRRGTQAVQQ